MECRTEHIAWPKGPGSSVYKVSTGTENYYYYYYF